MSNEYKLSKKYKDFIKHNEVKDEYNHGYINAA